MSKNSVVQSALERAAREPFEWGKNDCCLWVADIALELTGVDVAKPLRGYSSRFGAGRSLKVYAGGGLVEAAIKCADENSLKRSVSPYANLDIGVCSNEAGPVLALFWDGSFYTKTDRGVVCLPKWQCVIAWGLPCLQP